MWRRVCGWAAVVVDERWRRWCGVLHRGGGIFAGVPGLGCNWCLLSVAAVSLSIISSRVLVLEWVYLIFSKLQRRVGLWLAVLQATKVLKVADFHAFARVERYV